MGNHSSVHSNDEEILRPLHFHKICGSNIAFLRNNKIALRNFLMSYDDGLVFTDRPIEINEIIKLQISTTTRLWNGVLTIGFTATDPSSFKPKVPCTTSHTLRSKRMWTEELPKSLNYEGSEVSFFVDQKGIVFYQHNGSHKSLLNGVEISTPLWGVVNVYGNTASVELLHPDKDTIHLSNYDLTFHEVHGEHVSVDDTKAIATTSKGESLSYVFSAAPMKFDEKVLIKILEKDFLGLYPLEYGVTVCDPSILSTDHLPENADSLLDRSEYWVLEQDSNSYECGDVLIFTLTSEGIFMVAKNGSSVSSRLHVDSSQPLWLFLKLNYSFKSVSMIGTSHKEYANLTEKFHNLKTSEVQEQASKISPKFSKDSRLGECIICYENQINCTLYRCGHMCMCYECADKLRNRSDTGDGSQICPVCRERVEDVIKVYT